MHIHTRTGMIFKGTDSANKRCRDVTARSVHLHTLTPQQQCTRARRNDFYKGTDLANKRCRRDAARHDPGFEFAVGVPADVESVRRALAHSGEYVFTLASLCVYTRVCVWGEGARPRIQFHSEGACRS